MDEDCSEADRHNRAISEAIAKLDLTKRFEDLGMDYATADNRGNVLLNPVSNLLAVAIGPFYTAASLAAAMGMAHADVADLASSGVILECETAEGTPIYPAFQLVDERRLDERLHAAQAALSSCPPWSVALWWVTPNQALREQTPLQWAQQEIDPQHLVATARNQAASWR